MEFHRAEKNGLEGGKRLSRGQRGGSDWIYKDVVLQSIVGRHTMEDDGDLDCGMFCV